MVSGGGVFRSDTSSFLALFLCGDTRLVTKSVTEFISLLAIAGEGMARYVKDGSHEVGRLFKSSAERGSWPRYLYLALFGVGYTYIWLPGPWLSDRAGVCGALCTRVYSQKAQKVHAAKRRRNNYHRSYADYRQS